MCRSQRAEDVQDHVRATYNVLAQSISRENDMWGLRLQKIKEKRDSHLRDMATAQEAEALANEAAAVKLQRAWKNSQPVRDARKADKL